MYDFLDLKLIRFINEETSLSAVATRARMSLPAVSQRLSKLEDTFNQRLVFRSGPFGLTPAGKILLDAAKKIAIEAEHMEARLRDEKVGRATTMRIGCTEQTIIDDLLPSINQVASNFPGLHIKLLDYDPQVGAKQIQDGLLDIVFGYNLPHSKGLEALPYRTERACLITPLTHPLAQLSGPITLAEALPYSFISTPQSTPGNFTAEIQNAYGRSPITTVEVCSVETQCIAVGQTELGIAIVLEGPAKRHARTQPIHVVRLKEPWASREQTIYVSRTSDLSPAAAQLVSLELSK